MAEVIAALGVVVSPGQLADYKTMPSSSVSNYSPSAKQFTVLVSRSGYIQ